MMALSMLVNKYGLILVQDLINIFLKLVPRERYLADSLLLMGGLHSPPQVIQGESLTLDFDFRFEDGEHPNRLTNYAQFTHE